MNDLYSYKLLSNFNNAAIILVTFSGHPLLTAHLYGAIYLFQFQYYSLE